MGVAELASSLGVARNTIQSRLRRLEESGLLGSKYYVAHPTFPLDKIAGVINIDAMSVAGRAKDLTVTGFDGVPVDGLSPYELTTLVQAPTDKGRAAGAAVAAMLDGRAPASVLFTCTFREGNTTGPLPR